MNIFQGMHNLGLCHFQWNFKSGGISFMKLFVRTMIQNKTVDFEKV